MGIFDNKHFNSEVFARYMDTVPLVKQNALVKAGVFRDRQDLAALLPDQVGGNYIVVPMMGRLDGKPYNYNGSTDIGAKGIDSYMQGIVVWGRAMGWTEKDFSYDITGGTDFMAAIARQIADYWDGVRQSEMLSVLKGIFAMSKASGNDGGFVDAHTYDISGSEDGVVGPTTLNIAMQQATGANKGIFTVVVMHSAVSTNLENLKLLDYAKYTDAQGIEHTSQLAEWNGRAILIDDEVPTTNVAAVGTPGQEGYKAAYTKYTTYVMGVGAFTRVNAGVKVPYETARNASKSGGEDYIYTRNRVSLAPYGISFDAQVAQQKVSPEDTDLEAGSSWHIVKNAANNKAFDHKAIPIARIISRG